MGNYSSIITRKPQGREQGEEGFLRLALSRLEGSKSQRQNSKQSAGVQAVHNPPPTAHTCDCAAWYCTTVRRGYERLVRKLLQLPKQPAVVIVSMYAYCKLLPCGQ
jgi:hypothetical protein